MLEEEDPGADDSCVSGRGVATTDSEHNGRIRGSGVEVDLMTATAISACIISCLLFSIRSKFIADGAQAYSWSAKYSEMGLTGKGRGYGEMTGKRG